MHEFLKEQDDHVNWVIPRVYSEFDWRTDNYIAKECNADGGLFDAKYLDPMFRTKIFNHLLESQYLSLQKETCRMVADLFAQHNLSFRLSHINVVVHGYHRICLVWFCRSGEYIFDFVWDSNPIDTLEPCYKLALVSPCGEHLEGDILHDTVRFFEEEKPLPKWFIDGLSRDS